MQSSSVTLICGSHVISSTTAYVIRGMVNSMDITLLDDAGTALDITDVSTWDLGITEDFFGATGVLAGSSTITAAENVLAVTMNGHTEELASLMDGKKSIQAYATLRGRDASDVINRLYVFPVVILNIGFTNDTILTTAAQELTYTKAQIDYLLSQLPGGTGAEKIENKTQEIDTEEPSAEKYPSEAATVTYVAGQVSSLNTAISGKVDKEAGKVLSDNNFTTAEKNKLESALTSVPDASESVKGILMLASAAEAAAGLDTGKAIVPATLKTELDKKENTANKATDFAVIDDNKFPTVKAVNTYVAGQVSSLNAAISGKVDKEAGKGLSTNDFTDAEKNKLESALTSVPDASTAVKGVVQIATGEEVTAGTDDKKAIVPATLKTELDKKANTSAIPDITGKVDKVEGKDLSTNDFTDAYKTKVDADVESVTALPSPAVSLLSRVYFLTADDGTKKKGTTWKCVADGESYVFQQIQTDLNQLTDTTGLFAAKEDAANKATDFSTVNDTKYPSVKAVKDFAQNETLTELTGSSVTVAPWTQTKYTADGVCTITATGWAESGHQVAYVLITFTSGATLSVSGATVADDDALSAAGTYACYLVNENGTVYFRVANFTEAA